MGGWKLAVVAIKKNLPSESAKKQEVLGKFLWLDPCNVPAKIFTPRKVTFSCKRTGNIEVPLSI